MNAGVLLTQSEGKKVDFQNDILPILSSNKDDEVYKCTTCHAAYAREDAFDREKLDAIIAQVEGLRMPLNGDEMRKEQIELIKKWRDQKFPIEGPLPGGAAINTKPDTQATNWDDDDWNKSENSRPNRC